MERIAIGLPCPNCGKPHDLSTLVGRIVCECGATIQGAPTSGEAKQPEIPPRPWAFKPRDSSPLADYDIQAADGTLIIYESGFDDLAPEAWIGSHIVKCVNAYDALTTRVAELEAEVLHLNRHIEIITA